MIDGLAIVPPMKGEDGYVELSRTKQGRIFEKQILNYGDLLYPGVKGGKVHIDDDWADKLIENFDKKVCDIVQVPKAGPNNEHTEDPDRNIGEVIGLSKRNGKIYAKIDARSEEDADKLGKTLLGASAMLHLNYKDTHTGKTVGPTLLHVAVTNRPYVTGLEDYEEILAASADGTGEAVFLTAQPSNPKKEKTMSTLDELLAELKADHNIDVPALQARAAESDKALSLSNKIQEELVNGGILKLSNADGAASQEEILGAVAEAGTKLVELSNKIDSMEADSKKKDAEARVDSLIRSGHILPAKREANVALLLSNADTFEALLPEKPLVKLSNPLETTELGTEESGSDSTAEDEIARLTSSDAAKQYIRV